MGPAFSSRLQKRNGLNRLNALYPYPGELELDFIVVGGSDRRCKVVNSSQTSNICQWCLMLLFVFFTKTTI
ncbi:hypothetical protein AB3S75_005507 [Citrus x aurantiifolia]